MRELVTVSANLTFNPPNVTKKHVEQSEWKAVALAVIDSDITKYYTWFIKKRFGLELIQTVRGGHVTFISDRITEMQDFDLTSAMWDGKIVEVDLNLNVRTNGKHWWLQANCETFDIIRKQLGLGNPYFKYHLTIGYPKPIDLEFSHYLYKYLLTYK